MDTGHVFFSFLRPEIYKKVITTIIPYRLSKRIKHRVYNKIGVKYGTNEGVFTFLILFITAKQIFVKITVES